MPQQVRVGLSLVTSELVKNHSMIYANDAPKLQNEGPTLPDFCFFSQVDARQYQVDYIYTWYTRSIYLCRTQYRSSNGVTIRLAEHAPGVVFTERPNEETLPES